MNGILLVNKEKGYTSQDVVSRIRRIFNIKKVGHAGTLDPLATGVVVVLINEATKLSNYLLEEDKEYACEIVIGKATDTEDATGKIVEEKEVEALDNRKVDSILKSINGRIVQVPPMYSAIKIDGKKLYELARKGITVEREPRFVNIYSLDRTSDIVVKNNEAVFSFVTKVSKGTYIRTLCTEIGLRLEYPAYMNNLMRISSGNFRIEDSYSLKDIEEGNYKIIPMLEALNNYRQFEVDEEQAKKVKNGMPIFNKEIYNNEELIVLSYNNELLAIYKKSGIEYKAERVWI